MAQTQTVNALNHSFGLMRAARAIHHWLCQTLPRGFLLTASVPSLKGPSLKPKTVSASSVTSSTAPSAKTTIPTSVRNVQGIYYF